MTPAGPPPASPPPVGLYPVGLPPVGLRCAHLDNPLGIVFTGRKELPRILLPEDWPGHPLRKDWDYPADYHGVPIVPPEGL